MAEKKVVNWFTMNGKHIPIFEGESKEDAVKRSVDKGRKNQPVTEKYVKKLEKDYLDNNRKEWAANREAKRAKSDGEILKAMDKSIEYQRKANAAKYKLDDTLDNHSVIKSVRLNKKKSVAEQNEEIKAKQIAQNKAQADRLNGKKSNVLFKFDWEKLPGSATAHGEMVKYLKKNKIDWFNTPYFDLVADVDRDGNYYKLDHKGNGVVVIDRSKAYKKK